MDNLKGYLLTVLGALVGGTIPAYAITAGTATLVDDGNAVLGLLLSLGKQPHAGKTAVLLIAVLPFFWIALMPIMDLTALALSDVGLTILRWSLGMLAPLAARWLATWRRLFPSPQ